jgi:hypothetical protein
VLTRIHFVGAQSKSDPPAEIDRRAALHQFWKLSGPRATTTYKPLTTANDYNDAVPATVFQRVAESGIGQRGTVESSRRMSTKGITHSELCPGPGIQHAAVP